MLISFKLKKKAPKLRFVERKFDFYPFIFQKNPTA